MAGTGRRAGVRNYHCPMTDDTDATLLATTQTELVRALEALDAEVARHEDLLAESRVRLQAEREIVDTKVARYQAAVDLNETVADMGLVREMYWEHPFVRVELLAQLIQVRGANMVAPLMGDYTIEWKCRGGCGITIKRRVPNRTAAKDRTDSWRWCAECNDRREREAKLRWVRASEARDDEQELFDQAIASGAAPTAVYAEYPGVPGTWRVDNLQADD